MQNELIQNRGVSLLSTDLCHFCQGNFSKYVCPRCSKRYCGLACYGSKDHLACKEQFSMENSIEHLQAKRITNEERQKMMDILYQLRHLDSELEVNAELCDDTNDSFFEKLLELDISKIDSTDLWDLMPDSLRQEFITILNDNEKGDLLLNNWIPWWTTESDRTDRFDIGENTTRCIPAILDNIPRIEQLTRQAPSVLLGVSVVDIIISYVTVMRTYHGDIHDPDVFLEVFSDLKRLTVCFQEGYNGLTIHLLLSARFRTDAAPISSYESTHLTFQDTSMILEKQEYVTAALSDLARFFENVPHSVFNEHYFEDATKKELYLLKKKILFHLSWVHSQNSTLSHYSQYLFEHIKRMASETEGKMSNSPDILICHKAYSNRNEKQQLIQELPAVGDEKKRQYAASITVNNCK